MVVKGIRFEEVDNVESIFFVFLHVGDSEVVPLGEALCVVVWLENHIIFKFINLDGSS